MSDASRWVPWVVAGLGLFYLAAAATPPRDREDEMRLQAFANLPVLDGGRVKPIDTWARTQMMLMSKRQYYRDPPKLGKDGKPAEDAEEGRSEPAIRWMLNTMSQGMATFYRRVPAPDSELRQWLELKDEKPFYSVDEVYRRLEPKMKEMAQLARRPRRELTSSQLKKLHLTSQVLNQDQIVQKIDQHYTPTNDPILARVMRIENDQVLAMLGLERREGLRYALAELNKKRKFQEFLDRSKQAEERDPKDRDLVDKKVLELRRGIGTYLQVSQLGGVLAIPPSDGSDRWQTIGASLLTGDDSAATRSWRDMLVAYGSGDVKGFNSALEGYQTRVERVLPGANGMARLETWFNHFAPFYQCIILYAVVALLGMLSWGFYPETLRRSAFALALLTLLLHTLALGGRMYLQGRPPVTNLYSSAVFIGWIGLGMCLLMEGWFLRNGIGTVVAGWLGFSTMIIAHHLASSGDTLEMMQAVLDTNFWLATHVVCITIGYAATFVAGLFGIIYIVRGLLTTSLDPVTRRDLGRMMYGTVCFATLFSFVGTVLGGIWADQSWGRFWGWDPKENGALLIVIMNALILHARWGGMVKDRGIAVLAILGNMVTAWSWFGTNQLGVGLHAYGFNNTLAVGCAVFWVSQLVLVAMGLIPLEHWRSFQPRPQVEAPAAPAPQPAAPAGRKPRKGPGSTGIVPA